MTEMLCNSYNIRPLNALKIYVCIDFISFYHTFSETHNSMTYIVKKSKIVMQDKSLVKGMNENKRQTDLDKVKSSHPRTHTHKHPITAKMSKNKVK